MNSSTSSNTLDWTICQQQNPNQQRENLNHQQNESPIILKYATQSLATIKPRLLIDLIQEAATEFNLKPNEFHLTILIKGAYIKMSHSLYERIAPLSTIHVQLNSSILSKIFEASQNSITFTTATQLNQLSTPITYSNQSKSIINTQSSNSSPTSIISLIQSPISTQPKNNNNNLDDKIHPPLSPSNKIKINCNKSRKKFLINSLANQAKYHNDDNNQNQVNKQELKMNKFPFLQRRKSSLNNNIISSNNDTEQMNKRKRLMTMESLSIEIDEKSVNDDMNTSSSCAFIDQEENQSLVDLNMNLFFD